MTVLKFRVTYEDDDAVFRDIEILSLQTLIDFEAIIIQSYNLPSPQKGAFTLSNDNWHRLRPLPMRSDESRKGKAKAQAIPALVVYIDDPHQKFIYDYSGTTEFTFLAELFSISGAVKKDIDYPVVVRTQGASPFKKDEIIKRSSPAPVSMDDEEDEEEDVEPEESEDAMEEVIDDDSTEDLMTVNEDDSAPAEEAAEEEPVEEDIGEDDFEENIDEATGDAFKDDLADDEF